MQYDDMYYRQELPQANLAVRLNAASPPAPKPQTPFLPLHPRIPETLYDLFSSALHITILGIYVALRHSEATEA